MRTKQSVVLSFRPDKRLQALLENTPEEITIQNIVEEGLFSMAKNGDLLQAAIRLAEDRMIYYSNRLSELKSLQSNATAPALNHNSLGPRPRATTAVRTRAGACYWVPADLAESHPDLLIPLTDEEECADGCEDWPVVYSVSEIEVEV